MKVNQLFPRKKRPGRIEISPFTPEQALTNKWLLIERLTEAGLMEAARVYFQDFFVGAQRRTWLLPSEDISDLKDAHIDHVLKHWSWYKTQLEKAKDLVEDDVPWL